MAVVTAVEVRDGEPVVCHRADARNAADLCQVGARLRAAAHPGVVAVRASAPDGDGWELVTAHAGAPVTPALVATPTRIAALGSAAAATLADLHGRGVVHGRLVATRVLVRADGAPVLCGLGADDAGATPADDVGALGSLLVDLLDELPPPSRTERAPRELLQAVLARATTADPGRRPAAADLARQLAGHTEHGPERRRGRAVGLAALGILGLGLAARGLRPPDAPPIPRRSLATAPTTTVDPCVAVEGRAIGTPPCQGDAAVEGGSVVVDGARSVVGRPGDEVAVGDWDCDGALEPALLRAGTGEVLVFGPAAEGGARPVIGATRVPGATRLAIEAAPEGCAALGVVDGTGRRTEVGPLPPSGS